MGDESEVFDMSNLKRNSASPHDFDTASDLLVEGVIHPDDVAAIAGLKMQREEAQQERSEWECVYDNPDWEPPYTNVAEDF